MIARPFVTSAAFSFLGCTSLSNPISRTLVGNVGSSSLSFSAVPAFSNSVASVFGGSAGIGSSSSSESQGSGLRARREGFGGVWGFVVRVCALDLDLERPLVKSRRGAQFSGGINSGWSTGRRVRGSMGALKCGFMNSCFLPRLQDKRASSEWAIDATAGPHTCEKYALNVGQSRPLETRRRRARLDGRRWYRRGRVIEERVVGGIAHGDRLPRRDALPRGDRFARRGDRGTHA